MREDSLRSAGENGGHPLPFLAEAAVTHREDPAIERYQSSGPDSILDQPPAYTQVDELSPSDDSVLPFG
jgi:hypothetical protein